MEQIVIDAINSFLSKVEDFSTPVSLCINHKDKKACVADINTLQGEWVSLPIRHYIKLNDKGLIEPNKEAIASIKFNI